MTKKVFSAVSAVILMQIVASIDVSASESQRQLGLTSGDSFSIAPSAREVRRRSRHIVLAQSSRMRQLRARQIQARNARNQQSRMRAKIQARNARNQQSRMRAKIQARNARNQQLRMRAKIQARNARNQQSRMRAKIQARNARNQRAAVAKRTAGIANTFYDAKDILANRNNYSAATRNTLKGIANRLPITTKHGKRITNQAWQTRKLNNFGRRTGTTLKVIDAGSNTVDAVRAARSGDYTTAGLKGTRVVGTVLPGASGAASIGESGRDAIRAWKSKRPDRKLEALQGGIAGISKGAAGGAGYLFCGAAGPAAGAKCSDTAIAVTEGALGASRWAGEKLGSKLYDMRYGKRDAEMQRIQDEKLRQIKNGTYKW